MKNGIVILLLLVSGYVAAQQELRDIEEEREITGQYISVDAGDVEG